MVERGAGGHQDSERSFRKSRAEPDLAQREYSRWKSEVGKGRIRGEACRSPVEALYRSLVRRRKRLPLLAEHGVGRLLPRPFERQRSVVELCDGYCRSGSRMKSIQGSMSLELERPGNEVRSEEAVPRADSL